MILSAGTRPPEKNPFLAILICLALVQMSACSSSKTKEPSRTDKVSQRYSKTEGMIAVEADPFTQTDRQVEVFGEDLWSLGVLPVFITVKNNGDSPARIETKNFKLSLPSSEVVTPRTAAEVTKWLGSQAGLWGQVGMGLGQIGIGQIGQFAGPIGGIAGAIANGLIGVYRSNASREKVETYARGEFKDAMLAKNQFSRGFVFFMLPMGTTAFNEATLSLSVMDKQAETSRTELPLKALNFKGTAAK